MKDNKKRYRIYADMSLFLVALIWGGGFVAVKDALNHITPFYMMTIRFSLSALLLGIIFYKKFKKISLKELKSGCIIGVFMFGGFAFQTVGLKYTLAGKQAFLTAVYVVLVPFFTWAVTKKHPGWIPLFSAVMTFLGIGLLTLQKGFSMGYGDTLSLICAVFFAAHIVSIGIFSKGCDTIILSIVQLGAAAVLSFISALVVEPPLAPLNINALLALGYLVVFSTALAFLIQNVAQEHTSSSHAAIILCLESLFGSIFSVIFLKETFTYRMVAGCFIIFIAIIISETGLSFMNRKKGY